MKTSECWQKGQRKRSCFATDISAEYMTTLRAAVTGHAGRAYTVQAYNYTTSGQGTHHTDTRPLGLIALSFN